MLRPSASLVSTHLDKTSFTQNKNFSSASLYFFFSNKKEILGQISFSKRSWIKAWPRLRVRSVNITLLGSISPVLFLLNSINGDNDKKGLCEHIYICTKGYTAPSLLQKIHAKKWPLVSPVILDIRYLSGSILVATVISIGANGSDSGYGLHSSGLY